MSGSERPVFVDTNILVYAFDRQEGKKHEQAARLIESLWQTRTGRLSIQVMQEFHAAVTRGKGFSPADSQKILSSFAYWPVYSPRPLDVLQAIDLQVKYKLSFWDAMIVQSAAAAGCAVLYSEDLSQGQSIASVTIVNPFVQG